VGSIEGAFMPGVVETEVRPTARSRSARLGKALVGKRALIFAPLFLAAIALALADPVRPALAQTLAGGAVAVLAYALRLWATGYRTWVRKSGAARYLMSAGPYASMRHPLYFANGLAGAGALVALARYELLLVYLPLYLVVIGLVVVREEEALAERFGAEHAGYRAAVPGFFPVPWRRYPYASRRGEFSWQPLRTQQELWKFAGVLALVAFFVYRVA
jgi:protein-S-isoprenylcysteine O-methyltransferase Ste14